MLFAIWKQLEANNCCFISRFHAALPQLNYLIRCLLQSPFLNGIDVPEEQQNLPRAALLPVREEQVVAGDAQGASARRV